MPKRSLFNMIFGGKKQTETNLTKVEMLGDYTAKFTHLSNDIYDSKVARQCIDRLSTHTAKLMPRHILKSTSTQINGDINFLLSHQPNPINNTYDFLYRIRTQYETTSNAYVFIEKDNKGFITGFYPIVSKEEELLENKNGRLYLKFKFIDNKVYYANYDQIIHLRKFYNKNDFFGENNNVLRTDLETAHTTSEGISNAIKSTSNLRGILKYANAFLKEEDIEASQKKFVEAFVNRNNRSGIAVLDGKADFQSVKLDPIILDKDQLKLVNNNIYDYFGVNEDIINNSYTNSEWNAFYEGAIEPFAIQMSYEFTNKIFSDQAIREGNQIVFSTNRLQYASLENKINLVKTLASYGMLRVDEAREIIDLAPFGGELGDKILQSLNNIDSNIANDYQGGNG